MSIATRAPAGSEETWIFPGSARGRNSSLAAGAFATGAFLGVLSQMQPNGDSRQAAMQDLDEKRTFARGANIAFGAGALLAAIAVYHFIRYRDDIFGRTERYEDTP